MIKPSAICAVLWCLAAAAADADNDSVYAFLAGEYRLLGQAPDNGPAYTGEVRMSVRAGGLVVIRVIDDVVVHGVGMVETAPMADDTPVLRVRFAQAGVDYEATYLWRSDLDNYARLTGHVYRSDGTTKEPGLEALFIDHRGD